MDAEAGYPFFVPPPFAPFSSPTVSNQDKSIDDEKYQTISDLELHFNTLFMLESEKGRNASESCETSKYQIEQNYWPAEDSPVKNDMKRHESFSCSEQSTCSENNLTTLSDYGSLITSSSEACQWNQAAQNESCDLDNLWYAEKELFSEYSSNFTDRLSPESEKCPLPPLETAFSKHFSKFSAGRDASVPQLGMQTCNNLDLYPNSSKNKPLHVNNLDGYVYPKNLNLGDDPKIVDGKSIEFAELFDSITFDNNKPEDVEGDLITDLDSLNYFQDEDDDDMIGFEEYWTNDSSNLETVGEGVAEDTSDDLSSTNQMHSEGSYLILQKIL